MFVSVVATVLNEEASIGLLLDSLLLQERPPDEVIIVDGGSTDSTLAILDRYSGRLPLQVLVRPGCNISQGRNAGIAVARGEIIACTDAGVRLHSRWLAELMAPFEAETNPSPRVVCGFFLPDPRSIFETAMGATVLPLPDEIDPERFLPSSRSVAFTKSAWEMVGGYPEWLDYCEDLVFDLALRKAGVPFHWAPRALVYFRPRSNLQSFFRQYYQYSRGDGKADLWRHRHAIRYGSYLGGLAMLLGGFDRPWLWGLLLVAGLTYLRRPYRRLIVLTKGWNWRDRLIAALWVPVIRATGDVAKMVGYPVGVWWRLRRKPHQDIKSSREGGHKLWQRSRTRS